MSPAWPHGLFRRRTHGRLVDCERCGRDFVTAVDWHENDQNSWWIRIRCGECGFIRDVVISDREAARFDAELNRGVSRIATSLARLTRGDFDVVDVVTRGDMVR